MSPHPDPDVVQTQNNEQTAAENESPTLEEFAIRAAETMGIDNFETDVLPALRVLAESLQMLSDSDEIQSWTSADWLLGLVVLAHQHSTQPRESSSTTSKLFATASSTSTTTLSAEELTELLRFVRISDAVYADSPEQFCEEAKLPRETIVKSHDGGVLAPKYLLLVDDVAREIVLSVRGTASLLDFCTDICLVNEPFANGHGHRGIVHSAKWLVANVQNDLEKLTRDHPDYRVILTGHSLGAGVAALAAMELQPQFPGLKCMAFATPASVTEALAKSCTDYVTTVVNGDDCVPRFHQHSMHHLQGEVAKFDWRAALKQMVEEEIEDTKAEADEKLQEIRAAFDKIQKTQEKQVQEVVDDIKDTSFAKHVSASVELTKAAFSMDGTASDRIKGLKQIVQKHQQTGDDKELWTSIEDSVARLESLVNDAQRPQETQAILTKSKVLLASTKLDDEPDSEEASEFAAFRERIKNVIEQTTQKLEAQVGETLKEVSEKVTAGIEDLKENVEDLKEDVEAVIAEQTEKLEETVEAIQEKIAKKTEENESADDKEENKKTVRPLPPQETLFPPGRILFLRRIVGANESEPGVEPQVVTHDEFRHIVLSDAMILDHLCTHYERVLQTVDKSLAPRAQP